MAAGMFRVIPNFYRNFSKSSLSISANTYEKYILSREYCNARQNDRVCFLPNCRYHIILISNLIEFLQKFDAFWFNYQHVDCLYTLSKYRFRNKTVVKCRQFFDKLQREVLFNQQNREVDRMPSIAKKRLLRKRYKKTIVEILSKDQTNAN